MFLVPIASAQDLPPLRSRDILRISLVLVPGPQVGEQEDQAPSSRTQSTWEEAHKLFSQRLTHLGMHGCCIPVSPVSAPICTWSVPLPRSSCCIQTMEGYSQHSLGKRDSRLKTSPMIQLFFFVMLLLKVIVSLA